MWYIFFIFPAATRLLLRIKYAMIFLQKEQLVYLRGASQWRYAAYSQGPPVASPEPHIWSVGAYKDPPGRAWGCSWGCQGYFALLTPTETKTWLSGRMLMHGCTIFHAKSFGVPGVVSCRILHQSSNSIYIWLILCLHIYYAGPSGSSQPIHHFIVVFPVEYISTCTFLSPFLLTRFHPPTVLFPSRPFCFLFFIPPAQLSSLCRLFRRRPFRFLKGFPSAIDFLRAPHCERDTPGPSPHCAGSLRL